jgi:hypothetical protein
MRGLYNKVKDRLKGYFAILFFIILGAIIFIITIIAVGFKSFIGLFKKAEPQIMKPQPVAIKMERRKYMEGNPNLNVLFLGADNSGKTTSAQRLTFDSENVDEYFLAKGINNFNDYCNFIRLHGDPSTRIPLRRYCEGYDRRINYKIKRLEK